ncbi:LAFA_0E18580g1_1 [Lachancea sp. 'fantastica']|nr:LAFA_0E18580g1_1 [Lachancea sp. 'fantastica']
MVMACLPPVTIAMATYKKRHPSLYLLKADSSAQLMPDQDFELQPQSAGSQPMDDITEDEENQPALRFPSSKSARKRLLILAFAIVLSWLLVGFSVWRLQSARSLLLDKQHNLHEKLPNDRSFNMTNVLNGDFSYRDVPFAFIKSGALFQAQENDGGLYLTIDDRNGIPKYVAGKLADRKFYRDLGRRTFGFKKDQYEVSSFVVTHRLDFAIMSSNMEKEYRHSSKAYYWLKDIAKSIITPITPFPDNTELQKLSYAGLSPSGNFVYFVHESNLYIQNVLTKTVRQLSSDGSDQIFNGKTDWVYEEEVLATDCAVWWAHDDSKLVWARFDDSKVLKETLPKYINEEAYDGVKSINYPKPGTPNPMFTLFSYDVMTGALHAITQPDESRILYHAQWLNSTIFLFKDSDRNSEVMSVKVHNLDTNMVSKVREIDTKTFGGWVEKGHNVQLIPSKASENRHDIGYVDIEVDDQGFPHLYYFTDVFSGAGRQLTSGSWEVTGKGVAGYDYDADVIFFHANLQNRFSQHLYSVSINENDTEGIQTLQDPSEKDAFYEFELSPSCNFGLKRYRGPMRPMTDAGDRILLLMNDQSRAIIQLTNNSEMLAAMDRFDMPIKNHKTSTLDDGTVIDYMESIPAEMSSLKKHPLLVHVYGGPGSHTVDTSFTISLEESLASSEEAIVLKIEPRGTGGRGWKYRSWAKHNLGFWEARDVLSTVKKYMDTHADLIDPERVAIWGWSYGGFVTLKTLELDGGDTFKYGVAVAPVTDWKFYNSIYTERYMGSYEDNQESYDDNAMVKDVANIAKVQRVLLMHGSADDNVHLKNTMNLLDKLNLVNANNYDFNLFPDSDHSIVFHNAGTVIYEKLFSWIKAAFAGQFENPTNF